MVATFRINLYSSFDKRYSITKAYLFIWNSLTVITGTNHLQILNFHYHHTRTCSFWLIVLKTINFCLSPSISLLLSPSLPISFSPLSLPSFSLLLSLYLSLNQKFKLWISSIFVCCMQRTFFNLRYWRLALKKRIFVIKETSNSYAIL